MSLSMYDVCIPPFLHGLDRLSHFLVTAQAHIDAQGGDPADLLSARLADDMLPLSGQIQRASDTSKLSAQRLSGVPSPSMPDTEQTLDQLQARIAATVAYLRTIEPAQVDAHESADVRLETGKLRVDFTGRDYLLQFALPNFQFHVVTAYAILRHHGVPLGKLDFLGRIGTVVDS